MTISEVLESVRFVVDRAGKPTAAVVDIEAWESFVQALEDLEDNHLLRAPRRVGEQGGVGEMGGVQGCAVSVSIAGA